MLNKSELYCRTFDYPFLNPQLYPVEFYQKIIYGWILPIIGIIGLLGNVLIFSTLFHGSPKYSRYPPLDTIIKVLSVYDCLVILCSLWLFFVPTLTSFEDFINGIFPRTVPIMYPIFHAAVTGCNYLTVTIVMERILAIDGRFTDTKTWSSGITTVVIRKYILAVVLFTIGFNIPLFFETGVNGDAYPLEVFETDFKCHPVYFKLYRLTLELLIFKVTTWFGLTVMFWTITGKISYYTSKKRRLILSIKQVAELRDTRIVLGLVVLFFFTNALPLCISIVNILRFDIPEDVTRTGNLLLTINSSLKILIFVLLFPNFRHRIIDFILHPCTKYFPEKSHILFHKDRSHAFLSPLVITVSHLDDLAEKNTPMTRRDHACVQ